MAIRNHLIIGLGGSGGKILKAFRKRIYEEFRCDYPVKDGEKSVNIGYLWIDSDPKDLNETLSWKVLGHGVHLGLNDRLLITGVNAGIVDNIYNYPNIEPWLGDPNAFKDVLKGTIGTVVGGQRRRLGRLLFAYNAGKFCNSVRSHVSALAGSSNSDDITFHICAGLAGGTGSGSIIDAIAQCRAMYPDAKIIVYTQMPDRNPKHGFDSTGNYHANGYAALTELNAISVGEYMPHDVSGERKDPYGKVIRLLDKHTEAFNACWVFGNEIEKINNVGKVMDVVSELPVSVSDFLFQKIVATQQVSDGQLQRVIDAENGDGTPEMEGADTPVRGKRFASFGIKRVEYPESEIQEFATYSFARQVALQFKYNTFIEGMGYTEKPEKEIGMNQYAEIETNNDKLLISDYYLTLSKKMEDNAGTKTWREIDELWMAAVERFAADAQKASKKEWLSAIKKDCELLYNQNYRSTAGQGGVNQFYINQRDQLPAYASFIRRNIEKILFSEWRSGKKSFIEAEKYVLTAIDYLGKRDAAYEKQVNDRTVKLEQVTVPELKRSIDKWGDIFGFWGKVKDAVADNSQTILTEYKKNLREFYQNRTWIEAYKYAHELNIALCNELYKLQEEIKKIKNTVDTAIKVFNDNIGSKCKENDATDVNDMVVKLYSSTETRKIVHDFELEKKRQEANASAVRTAMVKIGDDQEASTFASLNQFDADSFLDLFIGTCASCAHDAMGSITVEASKMLKVNILEKIKYEYGREEKLEKFIKELISSAGNFVRYNDKEMNAAGSTPKMSALTLVLPAYKKDPDYRERFIQTFANNVDSGIFSFNPSDDVVTNYKDNQIVIISASSIFPLRYIDNLTMLRERFEARLIGPQADMNRLVLFTEGDGKAHPGLFADSIMEKQTKLRPYVILGYAMGAFEDKKDPVTGSTYKAIGFEDEFGDKGDWILCGKNILASVEVLSAKDKEAAKVIQYIEGGLKANYIHLEKKKELRQAVIKVIKEQVLPLCGNNDLDERYLAYKAIAKELLDTRLVISE